MSTFDYTVGEAVGGYGAGYRQPTGTGLPGYEADRFSAKPNLALVDIKWCESAGCPRDECVACKAAGR